MTETKLRRPQGADGIRTAVIVGAACTAIVGMGVWLGRTYPLLVGTGVVGVLAGLVRWHAATTGYRCPECGRGFIISAWADLLSPHMLTTKYVKCPGWGRRAWMEALIREQGPAGRGHRISTKILALKTKGLVPTPKA
jgi:DNA-directed RNA polymerase subunit RPC12/RpoP